MASPPIPNPERAMNETPTPRTDEHQFPCMTWPSQDHPTVVRADFSRKLERELTEVTRQRDALAEALRKLADCDWVITLPNRMDAVRTIANEALKSLTTNKL